MILLRNKQNQWYLLTIFLICVGLIGGCILFGIGQTQAVRLLLLEREEAIAGSLLDMGVSQKVIAAALDEDADSGNGQALLLRIGRTKNTSLYLFPSLQAFQYNTFRVLLPSAFLCVVLMFGATILFLLQLDSRCRSAEHIVRCFAGGDFSAHLPRTGEGTFSRLLSAVDDLACALRTKGETEQRAKEFLRDTISDISHQLKTPLAALRMYHAIIEEEPGNPAVVTEFAQKTEVALGRMERLILDLLKITRLDAGGITFRKEWVQVSELVRRAMADLETRAVREQKLLAVNGAQEEALVCDLEWTSEALGNLIKNGLDHIDTGGQVSISWERSPAVIRITVADNGHGIAAEDIHHIFKRFYRSSHSLDRQGVGLGLSLAKTIIEGQSGVLSVYSDLGRGAAFTISFLTEP